MRRLVIAIAGLAVTLTLPVSVLAQEAPAATPEASPAAAGPGSAFAISPAPGADPSTTEQGYFVYELAAGAEATGSVRLENTSQDPVTVELTAVDAETAQAGGSAFASAETSPTAAGTWVRLDTPQVTLEPGEQTSVSFTVEPPAETAPGQYLAGLAAYIPAEPEGTSADLGANQAGASIVMQTRYVIGVQIDVPGEWTPALEITGASALEQPSGTKLGIAMRNSGDTFLQPEGSVTLTDAAQTPVLQQPIALDTFVTGTDITYPIAWPGAPQAGEYGVAVELRYADDKVARYSGMLAVSEEAPAAQPAPGETQPPVPAPQPAPQPAPLPIPMGILYAIVALLAAVVVLLAVLVVRGSRRRW